MTDEIPADMADALARFKQAAEAITISFLGGLETEPAPLALYYYTDKVGLEGILSSESLWVCVILTMNALTKYGSCSYMSSILILDWCFP